MFETPTIAGLAERIEKATKTSDVVVPPVTRRSPSVVPKLSYAQQRLWVLEQLDPSSSVYNALLPIQFDGSLDVAALEDSLNEIVRRHEALRTSFPEVDGEPLLGRHVRAIELPARRAARGGLSDRPESRGKGGDDLSPRGLETTDP